jgi:hypothetical protein
VSVKSRYVRTFAKELGRFAVWQPGDPTALGDFGTSAGGEFRKLGNLRDFGIEFPAENSGVGQWEFTSEGVSSAVVGVQADVGSGPLMLGQAKLEISFARENSLFVRAVNSRWTQVANVHDLAGRLQEDDRWDFDWRFVAGVRDAESLVVLLSTQAGASVSVQGEAPALQQFQVGAASAGTGVSVTAKGAFSYTGGECPLLTQLVKVRRFPLWRSAVKYSTGAGVGMTLDPFVEVDPRAELVAGD